MKTRILYVVLSRRRRPILALEARSHPEAMQLQIMLQQHKGVLDQWRLTAMLLPAAINTK